MTLAIRHCTVVSLFLMDLHWLPVPQRVQCKLCVLVYGCLNGTAPGYLSDLTVSVGSTARRQLRSASTSDLVVPPTRRASINWRPCILHCRFTSVEQSTASPPLNLQIPVFLQKITSFLFGFSLWS